jgi:hypothetical protein
MLVMIEIGSKDHRDLFCNHFIETYTEYVPASLPWPELNEAELERIRAVPFWQEVLHTERKAGAIVQAFAQTIDDPAVRGAVELQGLEEARHAKLIREMIARYGIDVSELALDPLDSDLLTAFKDFGFGECLDSFLGFGAFKLARQSGFLPESMFRIFDILMYEETRHIVFFINWMAWQSVQRGQGVLWQRRIIALRYYMRAIGRLVATIRRGKDVNDGQDFSATQASVFLDGFTFEKFLKDCYAENHRRMSQFDQELLKPSFVPKLADIGLSAMRFWTIFRMKQARPAGS